MKILYVLDFFYPHVGGVPTLFYNLAKEMVRNGHSVTVITTHSKGTRSVETRSGIKIYRLGTKREGFMTKALFKLLAMGERFDVVHTSTYSAMIPSFIFSFMKRIPKVISVHEVWSRSEWNEFTKIKGFFYFMEERILLKIPFDYYIVPSIHTKKDLKTVGVPDAKISVVPHGIDMRIFRPTMKRFRNSFRRKYKLGDSVAGIFVGKPTVFKGIDYLLDAIEIVSEKKDMKFIFLLSKSHASGYRKFLKRVSKSEKLKRSIVLLEPTPQHDFVAKMIAASDFLVMPSLTEGFGFAAAEAASIGVPSIVTKGTSLEEVIEHSKHGLHIPPRNSEKLAEAILKLASDKKLRARLAKAKKFDSWDKVVKAYELIYQGIVYNHKK